MKIKYIPTTCLYCGTDCGKCNLVCFGNVNWQENIKRIDKGEWRVQ